MKKFISIFISIFLIFNFTFYKPNVVYALGNDVTLENKVNPIIAIAAALLLGSELAFQSSKQLYMTSYEFVKNMPSELYESYKNDITTGVKLTSSLYNYLNDFIGSLNENLVLSGSFENNIAVNGTVTQSVFINSRFNFGGYFSPVNLPIDKLIDFYVSVDGGTPVKGNIIIKPGSTITVATDSVYRKAGLSQRFLDGTTTDPLYLVSGSTFKTGSSVSVCIDFKNPNLVANESRSVSVGFSPDFKGNYSPDVLGKTIPIDSSISALPNTWVNPLDDSTALPTPGTLVNTEVPSISADTPLQDIWDTIKGIPLSIWNLFKGALTGLLDAIKAIPKAISDVFNPPLNVDVDKFNPIKDKFNNPRFEQTWKKIKDMDTSRGAPPKITFNLKELFAAATSQYEVDNPFNQEEAPLIDFGIVQNYKFMGLPIIDFFRGIVGMGFIIRTFFYVWRKITPDDSLGG